MAWGLGGARTTTIGSGLGLGGAGGGGSAVGTGAGGVGAGVAEDEGEVDDDKDKVPEGPAGIRKLFSYSNAELIRGRPVTCMVWNKLNQDLLAVGYGRLDHFTDPYKTTDAVDEELLGGLVLFWSLRNPEYPEKVLRTNAPVTSMDFSKFSPMLLAVGLSNGNVNVFDVKREHDFERPIETSAGMTGGHTDPVWQVNWVSKANERVESLVSISTDGRVLQWSTKKGLLLSCLMRLAKGGGTGSEEPKGWISRHAAGVAFDFCPGVLKTLHPRLILLVFLSCVFMCYSLFISFYSFSHHTSILRLSSYFHFAAIRLSRQMIQVRTLLVPRRAGSIGVLYRTPSNISRHTIHTAPPSTASSFRPSGPSSSCRAQQTGPSTSSICAPNSHCSACVHQERTIQ